MPIASLSELQDVKKARLFLTGYIINEPKPGAWRVLTEQGTFVEAILAASCLVAPMQKSEVLLLQHRQHHYILAVLTEPSPVLNLNAKAILLHSDLLQIHNQITEIEAAHLYAVRAEVISKQADKILLN